MGSGSSFSSGGWAAVTDAGIIRSSAGAANGLVLQASSGDLRFYAGGNPPAERFRIKSNGYTGVGNFSSKPTHITDPLNVDSGIGTCNIGGNYIHLKRYSGGNTQYINAPQNNANLHISADDFIAFGVDHSSSMYSHGTEALRIMSSGKIKLGSGGDVVGAANVEIRYDDPVLLIRDTAENSADGDAKLAFGNNTHYPTAYLSLIHI